MFFIFHFFKALLSSFTLSNFPGAIVAQRMKKVVQHHDPQQRLIIIIPTEHRFPFRHGGHVRAPSQGITGCTAGVTAQTKG